MAEVPEDLGRDSARWTSSSSSSPFNSPESELIETVAVRKLPESRARSIARTEIINYFLRVPSKYINEFKAVARMYQGGYSTFIITPFYITR